MLTKNETLLRRPTSKRPTLLEEMKPYSKDLKLESSPESKEKLPMLKSPTQTNFFPILHKRISRESSKAELKEDQNMPKSPRIIASTSPKFNYSNAITRVAYKSRVGSVLAKPKLHNQDSFIIKPSLFGMRGNYIFAVCDGHGAYGHFVSQYIKDHFPSIIEETVERDISFGSIEKTFHRSVTKLCKGLQETGIEIAFSGSTLVALLILGNTCICGNVGDSRAVLGRFVEGTWESLGLSQDHNTKRNDERTRILNSNGRICQGTNENGELSGPERIWLPEDDIPGLAMTRSIGDTVSKAVGVISDPEIIVRKLTPHDKFIILASDGIWEYMSSEQAVTIVSKFWQENRIEDATVCIVNEAVKKWKKEEYVDDITVIIIFLAVTN